MTIKGLTDAKSLKPRLPRLGKLRKGGPKPSPNQPGPDLDHFRFTSEGHSDIETAFYEAYGDEPRAVNGVLFYDTTEENFSTWIECWDASGLVFRSDGEHWLVWREGDHFEEGEKPHQDDPDQVEIGRLEFLVPELVQMGYKGTVTLVTHSNHDLRNIASTLMTLERERGTLRGAEIVLRRVKEKIGVPGWGDRKGQRSSAEKWLVKLELPQYSLQELMAPPETRQLSAGNGESEPEAVEGEFVEAPDEESGGRKQEGGEGQDNGKERPYEPEIVRKGIQQRINRYGTDDLASQGKRGAVCGALEDLFDGESEDIKRNKRYSLLGYLVGRGTSKELTDAEARALLYWASDKVEDEGGTIWVPDSHAIQEAAKIIELLDVEAGQEKLL